MKKQDVEKLSVLARVGLSEAAVSELPEKLTAILDYVGQIQELSTTDQASRQPEVKNQHRNIMRPDQVENTSNDVRAALVAAFPDRQNGYLAVQKIIGDQ